MAASTGILREPFGMDDAHSLRRTTWELDRAGADRYSQRRTGWADERESASGFDAFGLAIRDAVSLG